MKVAIGSDHAGFNHKGLIIEYLQSKGVEVLDQGTYTSEPCDYPDVAEKVAKKVVDKEVDFGIVICGTGIGISIAANKVKGIRAAVVSTAFTAESAKNHNHANIIAFGERVSTIEEVKEYLDIFMNTKPSEAKRHINRVEKIHKLEGWFLLDNRSENKKVMVTVNLVINFFVETIVGALLGFFIGRYLDSLLFEDKQILVFVLLFLGLFAGLTNFIKRVLKDVNGGNNDEKE